MSFPSCQSKIDLVRIQHRHLIVNSIYLLYFWWRFRRTFFLRWFECSWFFENRSFLWARSSLTIIALWNHLILININGFKHVLFLHLELLKLVFIGFIHRLQNVLVSIQLFVVSRLHFTLVNGCRNKLPSFVVEGDCIYVLDVPSVTWSQWL